MRARRPASVAAVMLVLACACAPERTTATPAPTDVGAPPAAATTPGPTSPSTTALASPPPPAAPPSPPELPRGGRTLFPEYRLVGFCGTPGALALGPLLDHPANKAEKLLSYASQYAPDGRKVMPVFELIAVVVQAGGGADGKYRARVYDSVVDEYLAAARANKGLLLLNIQPGQSDFLSEVQRFERYLHEPDVGVALDPEWAMLPKQTPNHFYGQTTGDAINAVIAYLSGIVTKNDLPEKALVFHKVNNYVVKDEGVIAPA
ncbi:MAG: hypothetical protein ACRELB_15855, partial [Polyangiaceae bacterium]